MGCATTQPRKRASGPMARNARKSTGNGKSPISADISSAASRSLRCCGSAEDPSMTTRREPSDVRET
eukprot:scaffold18910_cov101-Isochrysis_galbana.AAC.4